MFYKAFALWMSALQPLHQTVRMARYFYASPDNPLRRHPLTRSMDMGLALLEQATAYGGRPQFDIRHTRVGSQLTAITEEVVLTKPYMSLLHFRKDKAPEQPRLLILAPLAGHYATLLRNTVAELLPDNDIYITDWANVRDVPAACGAFHFDDCTDYVIDSLHQLGPNTHVLAVCQPTVSALMATALLAQRQDVCAPASLTLISGPVDAHINPAAERPVNAIPPAEWHLQNTIFEVPKGYAGAGQLVFPGFLQLVGLLTLHNSNLLTRQKVIRDVLTHAGETDLSEMLHFFDEYLAVLDISAAFYLETLQKVFTDAELARGLAYHRDEPVNCAAITRTALLTIEGEQDEICKPGQTHAAHDLCFRLPASRRQQISMAECGHYSTWNGVHFREQLVPQINAFIRAHNRILAQDDSNSEDTGNHCAADQVASLSQRPPMPGKQMRA